MKPNRAIFAAVVMVGGALAQNPSIINNVQGKMSAVQQQQTQQSNEALGIQTPQVSSQTSKPSAGSATSAAKSTIAPTAGNVAKPAAAKPVVSAATMKAAPATTQNSDNKLEKVNVSHHADDVQIEIDARESVTANVTKLTSPDRLLVELPATVAATAENKIAVGSNGVKAIRIGMNSKTPPTTSVVVDLEHALNYEMSPGPSNKFVLTLHAKGAVQSTAQATLPAAQVAAKSSANAAKTQATQMAVPKPAAPPASPKISVSANASPARKSVPAPKTAVSIAKTSTPASNATAGPKLTAASATSTAKVPVSAVTKTVTVAAAPATKAAASAPTSQNASSTITAKPMTADDKVAPIGATADASKAPKPEEKKWAMSGKRDPFFSPVVQQTTGSGCSTGKKCLEIGQINVRGIVKSQDGFIAVVTNSLNKAYFLHENDPVFNGYVEKITGDSVVFQETYQDNLGKPVTREVTKRVSAPAV